jgi:hypothetical protein
MSQIAASHSHDHGHGDGHGVDRAKVLSQENIYAPEFGRGLSLGLLILGILGMLGCLAFGLMASPGAVKTETLVRQAAAAYHVGAVIALGFTLGPLGIVMILHQVAAGWSVTLRRQIENMAAMVPYAVGLVWISAVLGPFTHLWHWMHVPTELGVKGAFLNPAFFYVRLFIYSLVWIFLSSRLNQLSRQQDITGDKWLSNKAKFTSAFGLLLFALSVAFGGFDLVMTLDYHWFSTMFPVYFFAGNMITALSLTAVVLFLLRSHGKLKGLITSEHFHDLGKLMLGFTVFWAYIAFSQYFLIWYAGIPEETAWFNARLTGGWDTIAKLMMFGHFVGPFLVLLFRATKRTPALLALVGLWQILMHCTDIFWQIRPDIYKEITPHTMGLAWVDLAGHQGPPPPRGP